MVTATTITTMVTVIIITTTAMAIITITIMSRRAAEPYFFGVRSSSKGSPCGLGLSPDG